MPFMQSLKTKKKKKKKPLNFEQSTSRCCASFEEPPTRIYCGCRSSISSDFSRICLLLISLLAHAALRHHVSPGSGRGTSYFFFLAPSTLLFLPLPSSPVFSPQIFLLCFSSLAVPSTSPANALHSPRNYPPLVRNMGLGLCYSVFTLIILFSNQMSL